MKTKKTTSSDRASRAPSARTRDQAGSSSAIPGSKTRDRSPNLSAATVAAIVTGVLQAEHRPDWPAVMEVAATVTGRTYTRQALAKHAEIRRAYKDRRQAKAGSLPVRRRSSTLQQALTSAHRLRTELACAKSANEALVLELQRCVYNAHANGVSLDKLLEPLPLIERA